MAGAATALFIQKPWNSSAPANETGAAETPLSDETEENNGFYAQDASEPTPTYAAPPEPTLEPTPLPGAVIEQDRLSEDDINYLTNFVNRVSGMNSLRIPVFNDINDVPLSLIIWFYSQSH